LQEPPAERKLPLIKSQAMKKMAHTTPPPSTNKKPAKEKVDSYVLTEDQIDQLLSPLKRFGGKPSGADRVNLEGVRIAAAMGMTQAQIGALQGVTEGTFADWVRTRPEIELAWKEGKAHGINLVAGTLLRKALSGDVACIIFYLKTQAKWAEVADTPSAEELARQLREVLRQADAATTGDVNGPN